MKLPCISSSAQSSPLFRFRETFARYMTRSEFLVHRGWIEAG